MIKLPALPENNQVVEPSTGEARVSYWLFFSSIARWIRANQIFVRYGTHADRLALVIGNLPDGTPFVETDRDRVTYQVQAGAWVYESGMYKRAQTDLAALAATLGTNDKGLLVEVTDYVHILRWTGSAWEWAPEDDHRAGEITHFDVAPATGWKLLDGTGDDGSAIGVAHPISILKSDGTTRANTTAANLTAGVFIQSAAAYNGAVTPKTVPTVAAPVFAGNAVTPTGSVGPTVGTVNVLASSITSVATGGHGHALTMNSMTPSGTNSAPAATLPAPPVDYTNALPYIRK